MSQTIFLTPQSLLQTPDISLKDDSSLTMASTVGDSDISFSNSCESKNTSSDFLKKNKPEKEVDELTERLQVLKTRLDFKLTIANASKKSFMKNRSYSSVDYSNENTSPNCAFNIQSFGANSQIIHNLENMELIGNQNHSYLSNRGSEPCLSCARQSQIYTTCCGDTNQSDERKTQQETTTVEECHVWTGKLPLRSYKNPKYSNKVFLGGIPWDMTEQGLYSCFKQFGSCNFEWPGKDLESGRHPPKGYVYILFENERSVKNLLFNCTQDSNESNGEYFFKIATTKLQSKSVQVIPWVISDSSHLTSFTERLDTSKTIFVGGLHGMISAEILSNIFNDMFGGVIYAGIDTDKHKYPIGSGRITFSNYHSYAKAIRAGFVEIRTPKFIKKVQIDPYLEESQCSCCNNKPGPLFCREFSCFKYFCSECWQWAHSSSTELKNHRPVTRQARQSAAGDLPLSSNNFSCIRNN